MYERKTSANEDFRRSFKVNEPRDSFQNRSVITHPIGSNQFTGDRGSETVKTTFN